jgi:fucose permease
MAAGRAGIGPALRWSGGPLRLLLASSALGLVGVLLFWASPGAVPAVAGLVLAGLGIALLYPVALSEALASWPSNPVRAAARCALASGLAIGTAPLLLASLADITGLHTAFLIAPALLTAFLLALLRRLTAPARKGCRLGWVMRCTT